VADASFFLELDCVRPGLQSSWKVVGLREPEAHTSKVYKCTIAPVKFSETAAEPCFKDSPFLKLVCFIKIY